MEYIEIFIIGWNLNFAMFVINLLVAILTAKRVDVSEMRRDNEVLSELKSEFDKYYPNRRYEVLMSYLIPFTAFFRTSFRLMEMVLFFNRNKGTRLVDFMIYKYSSDIEKAKDESC